ncbi:hypothetical protein BDW71DRAFT_209986 [Aspergillus fruticulosus]
MQIFSIQLPESEHIWQLLLDAPLTGYAYHFFEQTAKIAKKQLRKYLWRRNTYFYIAGPRDIWKPGLKRSTSPWLVNRTYSTFPRSFQPTRTRLFNGVFWDIPPDAPRSRFARYNGPTFQSLASSNPQRPELSGLAVVSEMTASVFALWRGLKAVYVPHPVYADRKQTLKEINWIKSKGGPEKMDGYLLKGPWKQGHYGTKLTLGNNLVLLGSGVARTVKTKPGLLGQFGLAAGGLLATYYDQKNFTEF